MTGEERKKQILKILKDSEAPVSGTALAQMLGVSRQVVVQDIAVLRAANIEILSTNQGYLMNTVSSAARVFKVVHTDEEVEEELNLFVDCGGFVKDVFVYHKVYGVLRAEMNIASRLDVQAFVGDIRSGKSSLLKNITSNFHYHTVIADNEHVLDIIQERLAQRGFLAQLQDYEPVNFWDEV